MDVESRQHLLVEDGVCCEDVAEPLQVNVPVFLSVLFHVAVRLSNPSISQLCSAKVLVAVSFP